jgi:PAS domain S-box-containing protein
LNNSVLLLRAGISQNIDPINDDLQGILIAIKAASKTTIKLKQMGHHVHSFMMAMSELETAFHAREDGILRFVSEHAKLRNSVSYFKGVGQDLVAANSGLPVNPKTAVNALVLAMLDYVQTTGTHARQDFEGRLAALNDPRMPAEFAAPMHSLEVHGRKILEFLPKINHWMTGILNSPFTQAAHLVPRELLAHRRAHAGKHNFHRSLWIGVAFVLSLLLAWILLRLYRSRDALNVQVREAAGELEDEVLRRVQTEADYQSIFENAVEGIVLTTPEGKFARANPACAKMLGYDTPEELMSSITDIAAEIWVDRNERNAMLDDLRRDSEAHVEVRMYRKDGGFIWVSMSVSAKYDDDGGLEFVEAILLDITERRASEVNLKAAKEEAGSADMAKSSFLSSMSHELRTPLNAIIGFSQLLTSSKKLGLADKQKRMVDQILSSGQHLLALIDQVLDFSKIDAGQIDVNIVDVSADRICHDCVETASMLARAAEFDLVYAADGRDLPMVRADPTRLRQIILNLLSNAIKYNRPKGHAVLDCTEQSNGYARFEVTDTGEGIAKSLHEKVFVPFERLNQQTGPIEGSEIGLALSKRIADIMNAKMGFVSATGTGSTFWVDVPISSGIADRPKDETGTIISEIAPTDA